MSRSISVLSWEPDGDADVPVLPLVSGASLLRVTWASSPYAPSSSDHLVIALIADWVMPSSEHLVVALIMESIDIPRVLPSSEHVVIALIADSIDIRLVRLSPSASLSSSSGHIVIALITDVTLLFDTLLVNLPPSASSRSGDDVIAVGADLFVIWPVIADLVDVWPSHASPRAEGAVEREPSPASEWSLGPPPSCAVPRLERATTRGQKSRRLSERPSEKSSMAAAEPERPPLPAGTLAARRGSWRASPSSNGAAGRSVRNLPWQLRAGGSASTGLFVASAISPVCSVWLIWYRLQGG
mmetsp:Transcript_32741/g.97266  ORF Transcript_32741/g.97266 Transcript_32741/m.97266 type:complete len:299 (+) Transcript_32741:275-1171(+)